MQGLSPAVRRYVEDLLHIAADMSSVSPLDLYDNKECVSQVYVNVTTLSYDQAWALLQQQRNSDVTDLASFAGRAKPEGRDRVELIDLEVLLQRKGDGGRIYRSLVLGWGGSGKSILCRKILYDWKEAKPKGGFRQFLAVVYVSGKDERCVKATTVEAFLGLEGKYKPEECEEIVDFLTRNSHRVLVIFDGGDEVGSDGLFQTNTVLCDLLMKGRKKLANASMVTTSRPFGDMYKAVEKFDRFSFLVGLKGDRLYDLAYRRLNKDEEVARAFIDRLNSPEKAQVKAAAQETPLFAAMLIRLFSDKREMPSSITELYRIMLDKVLYRNARRRTPEGGGGANPGSDEGRYSVDRDDDATGVEYAHLTQVSYRLGWLALNALVSRRLAFTYEHVVSAGCSREEGDTGLLTTMRGPDEPIRQAVYTFHHLSWQEYLAARALAHSHDFAAHLEQAIATIGTEEHAWLFWRFVAGLLRSSLLPELVFQLLESMKARGNTIAAKRKRLFLLACVAEHRTPDTGGHLCQATTCLFPEHNLDIQGYHPHLYEVSALADILVQLPGLIVANLSNCGLGSTEMTTLAPSLSNFPMVDLSQNLVSGDGIACFSRHARGSQLRQLVLSRCMLTDSDAESLGTILKVCTSLTRFHLIRNELGSSGAEVILSHISECSPLEDLYFDGNDLNGLDGDAAGRSLSKASQLTTLFFRNCQLGNRSVSDIMNHLHHNVHMETLSLMGNRLTAAMLPALADLISARAQQQSESGTQSMMSVHLSGNRLSFADFDQLASQGRLPYNSSDGIHCGHLVVFHGKVVRGDVMRSFAENCEKDRAPVGWALGDYGAEAMANALLLQREIAIESVDLSMNGIGAPGAKALAESMSLNKSLQGLRLEENEINATAAHALAKCLSLRNCTLVYLNLGRNPVFSGDLLSQQCLEILLCKCPCLKMLVLCQTGVSDTECQHLLCSRQLGDRLAVLDLSRNSITDVGVEALSKLISLSPGLRSLSLSRNVALTAAGAKSLALAVKSLACKKLSCVWVGGNDIRPEDLDECSCECLVNADISLDALLMTVPEVIHHYLPQESNRSLTEVVERTTITAAFAKGETLHDVLQEAIFASDVQGLLCLVSRLLRCIWTSFFTNSLDYRIALEKLASTLVNAFPATMGLMKCVVGGCLLCVTDQLALEGHQPDLAVQALLIDLAKLHRDVGNDDVVAVIQVLVKLAREENRRELVERLENQSRTISSGDLREHLGKGCFD